MTKGKRYFICMLILIAIVITLVVSIRMLVLQKRTEFNVEQYINEFDYRNPRSFLYNPICDISSNYRHLYETQGLRSPLDMIYLGDPLEIYKSDKSIKDKFKLNKQMKSMFLDKSKSPRPNNNAYYTVLPFQNASSAADYFLNKASSNWFNDISSFSDIVVLLLDSVGYPNEKASFSAAYAQELNDYDDFNTISSLQNLIQAVMKNSNSNKGATKQKNVHVVGMQAETKQDKPAFGKRHIYASSLGAGFKIISAALWMNKLIDNDESVLAIISEGIYVDPNDLKIIMDATQTSTSSPIISIGDNCMILKKPELIDLSNRIDHNIYSFWQLPLPCNRCPYESGLSECLDSLSISSDILVEVNSAMYYNYITPSKQGFGSCKLPRYAFGFHEINLKAFEFCSFVSGIKWDYEYHAIRLLQRLSRGLGLEVNWKTNQVSSVESRKKCNIALGITSRPQRIDERMLVRKTWGGIARSMGQIKMFFIYGSPEHDLPSDVLDEMKREREEYRDIVMLPLKEGYFQMFKKVTNWLGWAYHNTTCDTVMKVDPDTYLRLFPLFKFLLTRKAIPLRAALLPDGDYKSGVYFGPFVSKAYTNRDPGHPWNFYDMWPHDYIPPFMSGSGMGMSRTLAKYIYDRRVPDMRLDDPGIGVILNGLSINTNRLRFEVGREWDAGTMILHVCHKDKITDNPFFTPDFDMTGIYSNDIFKGRFCSIIRNQTYTNDFDVKLQLNVNQLKEEIKLETTNGVLRLVKYSIMLLFMMFILVIAQDLSKILRIIVTKKRS